MIVSTSGIVLKAVPYKESSTITSVLTKEFGLKSYIIKGGRKKNATVKSNFFQPLQILSLVVYDNNKSALQQIKECSIEEDLTPIRCNIIKTSLTFFITEILNLSLKENNPGDGIFEFVKNNITLINNSDSKFLKDVHIYFLYNLACILGFAPLNNYSEKTKYFDLPKGCFTDKEDLQTLNTESSLLLHRYIINVSDNYCPFTENSLQRNNLLQTMIFFFEHHITNQKRIQSHKILHDLL